MRSKIKPYIISILIALAVGGLSAVLTRSGMEAYGSLNQPPLSPPPWVFAAAWSILFILMGVGSAEVYVKNTSESGDALKIYALQLAVNFFWSIIFFNMRAYLFAFFWLVLLWILIIIMIIKFAKITPLAALMQLPYLIWVTFAGYLCWGVYLLN